MNDLILILPIILPYLFIIFWIGIFLVIYKICSMYLKNNNKEQIKNVDTTIYYRDIPCHGNINLAYWLLYNFSNLKKDDLNNGLLGAYLLKWYKNGYIDIKASKSLGLKNDNYSIDLKDGSWDKNNVEKRIYEFLKNVAGNNNMLEKNEIKNYCSVDANSLKLVQLFQSILNETKKELEEKNYIKYSPSKNYILFKTQPRIILSDELVNEYQNLNGLKNFLEDYSNMEEKIHIEVHIWEDYLIFANLFGIANKVTQQLKKIYPQFNNLFDVSFEDIVQGNNRPVYRAFRMQFIVLLVVFLLVFILVFFASDNSFEGVLLFLLFIAVIVFLYWQLRKYFINKKVKEMNAKTYAKITNVNVDYHTETDSTTGKNVNVKTYYFTYKYVVNGVTYKGSRKFWILKNKGAESKNIL